MLFRRSPEIRWSEVTPRNVYLTRRRFLAGASAAGALAAGYRLLESGHPRLTVLAGTRLGPLLKSPFSTDEKQTPYNDITHYNNFYEFGTQKEQPAELAKNFKTSPWAIQVDGAVNKPRTYDQDMLLKLAPLEERIYRHRCVEGWSIVVPWIGFPLNALIKQVEPTSKAKYVAF
ncbi:MAG: molybdopterin-dependent oxidoreductase, partial [Acidobacteria bacterium]|nr:molybdopterin-dependent oxidoreductase [Acidobacteriota bacterium]